MFLGIACLACGSVDLVNPKTGKWPAKTANNIRRHQIEAHRLISCMERGFQHAMRDVGRSFVMAQRESQSRTASLSKGGVVQAERLNRFQAELFEKIQEVNRHWLERVQSEATRAAEFARKLASTRSFLDAATVYQEWETRQLKLAVEDASYAISTGEALMDMGSRLLEGEDKGKGSIVST
jgi:hypothetical protein